MEIRVCVLFLHWVRCSVSAELFGYIANQWTSDYPEKTSGSGSFYLCASSSLYFCALGLW